MLIQSKFNRHLIVRPEIPQWAIVDDEGMLMANLLFNEGCSVDDAICKSLIKDCDHAKSICQELLDLFSLQQNEVIVANNSLTSKTSVAMISVTNNCNLKCPHCYVDADDQSNHELGVSEHYYIALKLKQILAQDPKVEYRVILTGGEPFMNLEMIDIIKAYQSCGFMVGISSNGLLISSDEAKFLGQNEVDLSISLDGPTAQVHDAIRGIGSFYKLIEQIDMFVKYNVRFGINSLVHKDNFDYLEEIIQLAHDLGASGFNPINLVQLGRACDLNLVRVSEAEVFERIANCLVKRPEQLHLFEKTSLFSSMGAALLFGVTCDSCGIGNRPCVYINSVGDVFPCANTQFERFLLGNVRTGSLENILNMEHPIIDELRSLKVDTLNNECSKCNVRSFCGGDCRGETYNVTGNLRAPYVACKDRYDSILKMMWIVAENPELFETRANEFELNSSRSV